MVAEDLGAALDVLGGRGGVALREQSKPLSKEPTGALRIGGERAVEELEGGLDLVFSKGEHAERRKSFMRLAGALGIGPRKTDVLRVHRRPRQRRHERLIDRASICGLP